jgi:hypothetical protein
MLTRTRNLLFGGCLGVAVVVGGIAYQLGGLNVGAAAGRVKPQRAASAELKPWPEEDDLKPWPEEAELKPFPSDNGPPELKPWPPSVDKPAVQRPARRR